MRPNALLFRIGSDGGSDETRARETSRVSGCAACASFDAAGTPLASAPLAPAPAPAPEKEAGAATTLGAGVPGKLVSLSTRRGLAPPAGLFAGGAIPTIVG